VLGATIALALTPFTPAGVPIVAASVACLVGLILKDGTLTGGDLEDGRDEP
jgi:hypothetical protein